MKNSFQCPKCDGYLNVGNQIILAADNKNGDSGLLLLDPEIGNYSVETNEHFSVETGAKYIFFCPICHERLCSDLHDNLSRIKMIDEEGHVFEVLFSKIAGEKSTYKIIGENVDLYGEHASNYLDFINLSRVK